ncbi:substrate-binding domain-containing protein [Microbacterium sp. QXD-8]|uniref:Substrate-binding domain-containing protein n=1 Tax=Microbacterium psychrotolerans TaxID=3068321 RepID=A0ABU0YW01_9MICO|nr:substrate-binding domain-containing protein [Microbacterium sp. QXD-8]MDQ7876507.1 substrate-binding domain-containing protein [Microbacterium sp. QXD-8]
MSNIDRTGNSLSRQLRAALFCVAATSLALVGCAASPATEPQEESTTSDAVVEQARERVDAARAEVTRGAPETGPEAQPDKFIVIVPCALASEGCAQPAYAAKEAAETLGWRAQIIDGKETADSQNAAVRQALTLNPDGILTVSINPSTIQSSLAQAREEGVVTVASQALETDLVDFAGTPSDRVWRESGSLLADFAIAETDGNVKALVLHDTGFEVLTARYEAFIARLAECASCEILEEQTFTFADLATAVPRAVQQMAQRNADFNTIYIDYDYAVAAVAQGLSAVDAEEKIVLGSQGIPAALERIRTGEQSASTAFPNEWMGWTDVDAMNRIFSGEDPAVAADVLSLKLVDSTNIDEIDATGWDGDVDFKSQYQMLWGVE